MKSLDSRINGRIIANWERINRALKRHRIAQIERYVLPDATNPKNPRYTEAVLTANNEEVLEEITRYVNAMARRFDSMNSRENAFAIRIMHYSETGKHHLIVHPNRRISPEDLFKETAEFLSHAVGSIEDYEMKHGRR